MIRVCLVDDQTLVRQGIRSLLALDDGIEVVAEAADGRQAVELVPQVRPDVVLMDMRMPVMSGLEALQVLSRQEQLPPTIILTTFDDDQLVLAGLKAGAKGYLLKDVTLAQLVGAIRTVAEGGSLVQPAVTQRLLSGLEHMRNDFVSLDRPDPLTDRETEILRLMASGFSNKEIANSLGVAEGTIKNHVSNILSKLGVRGGPAPPPPRRAEGVRTPAGLKKAFCDKGLGEIPSAGPECPPTSRGAGCVTLQNLCPYKYAAGTETGAPIR